MPNLGNASLVLSSSGDQLKAGLSRASQDIQTWAGKTKSVINSAFKATSFAVGTALGFGIGELKQGISTVQDKLRELTGYQKRADVLGISASQLQGISLQLGKVGISAQEVNSLFAKMGKNLADSGGGHGRAAPALQQLGIDAKQLLALSPDKQFLALADAISKLPPGAEQASAALHIFGDEGQRLLPILQKGGQGIQEWIEQQKKTGNVLSNDQIKAAADAQKAWKEARDNIAQAWNGLVNRVVVAIAPILEVIGKLLKNLTAQVSEWSQAWGVSTPQVVGWLKSIAIGAAYLWDTFKVGQGLVMVVFGAVAHAVGYVIDAFKSLVDLAKELPDEMRPKWVDDFAKSLEGAAKVAHDVGREEFWGAKEKFNQFGQSAKDIEKMFDGIGKKSKDITKELKQQAAQGQAEYHGVEAALKGSTQAYSAQVRFNFESLFGPQQKIEEKQLEEQRKMNEKLDRVIDIWANTALADAI